MTDINNNTKKKIYTINNNPKNTKGDKIKSVEGYECIGPCYPANTYYYNPLTLSLISTPFPSCPIKEKIVIGSDGNKHKKKFDKCYDEDINKGNLYFDIFSDYVQVSTTAENFLFEIYNLKNISDIVHFLSNTINTLPIYSQRRLLEAIYNVYYKFVEFPKLLFCKKLLLVLKNIYLLNDLDENKILTKLNKVEQNNQSDLYGFFY